MVNNIITKLPDNKTIIFHADEIKVSSKHLGLKLPDIGIDFDNFDIIIFNIKNKEHKYIKNGK